MTTVAQVFYKDPGVREDCERTSEDGQGPESYPSAWSRVVWLCVLDSVLEPHHQGIPRALGLHPR